MKNAGLTGINGAASKSSMSVIAISPAVLQKRDTPLILMKTWTSADFSNSKGTLRNGLLFIRSELQSITLKSKCTSPDESHAIRRLQSICFSCRHCQPTHSNRCPPVKFSTIHLEFIAVSSWNIFNFHKNLQGLHKYTLNLMIYVNSETILKIDLLFSPYIRGVIHNRNDLHLTITYWFFYLCMNG